MLPAQQTADTSSLSLYIHDMTSNGGGVQLAPSAGGHIRDTTVDIVFASQSNNVFSITPQGPGAVLDNVHGRNFAFIRSVPPQVVLTQFTGPAPVLVNTGFEHAEVVALSADPSKPARLLGSLAEQI